MNNDVVFWHALRSTFDFGFETFQKIKEVFKKPRHAWQASSSFYKKCGFEKGIVEKIGNRKRIDPSESYKKLRKQNIEVISYDSKEYPSILKEISSPPPVLYYRGDIRLAAHHDMLAVVGTRKATNYGKAAVQKILSGFSQTSIIIVSGMALGIDGEAHETALSLGLKTIAVLGSGLDDASIYPQSHLSLARDILKTGLLISEFPPESESFPSNFPRRNRIISGLALGTLVIEAKEPSGALITAYRALEQNREVFAVPGSIFSSTSVGCNKIISKGAHVVTCAEDILMELNIKSNTSSTQFSHEPIMKFLLEKPLTFDEISDKTQFDIQTLSTKLLELEIDGKVAKKGGMYYKV